MYTAQMFAIIGAIGTGGFSRLALKRDLQALSFAGWQGTAMHPREE
jgi:hypothetical protein